MSVPGQASGRAAGVTAASGGRWWHFLLTTLLVLLSLPIFAAIALALRLWMGPIDVTDSARRMLAQDRTPAVSFSRMQLAWNGWAEGPSAPLGLVADGVRWSDPNNRSGNAAHASAAFDLPALLHGRIALLALRASDGSLSLTNPRRATSAHGTRHAGRGRLDLRQLSEFDISRMALTVGALAEGRPCRADNPDLRLKPLSRPAEAPA